MWETGREPRQWADMGEGWAQIQAEGGAHTDVASDFGQKSALPLLGALPGGKYLAGETLVS